MIASSRLRASSNISAASWVASGIGPFGSGARSLLPQGFEGYARILHPAWADNTLVPWSQVAAWSGRTIHRRVQFDSLARPASAPPRPPQPWERPPARGNMPPVTLRRLCEILAGHTQSPDRCWFCLWDGYGWIGNGATAAAHASTQDPVSGNTSGAAGQSPNDMELTVPLVFTEEIVRGPRVHLPHRSYFLLQGPLDAAMELGWMLDASHFCPQSPNLFWPDDHSWCVATEIDLDSSYVGGSKALVQRLAADEELEAFSPACS
jgi:hypothetical protein